MSRYAIPTISAADTDIAKSPMIGSEKRAFYSLGDTKYLGKFEQDAPDAGTLSLDAAYSPPSSYAEGYDVQVGLRQAMRSSGDFELSLNVKFAGVAITGVTSASPGVITTASAHGLSNSDTVDITGVTGVGATGVNGLARTVTVISPTTFSVGINTTGAGTGGSFAKIGTATATIVAPSHVTDQSNALPAGLAVDLIGDGADSTRKIRQIVSLDAASNGGAGNIMEFHVLPENDSWVELGCVEDINPTLPSREGVRIACGTQSAAYTKMGRETDTAISVTTKYQGYAEGAARLNGHRGTMKVENRQDNRLLVERMVFTDVISTIALELPDGNGEAKLNLNGIFSKVLVFA